MRLMIQDCTNAHVRSRVVPQAWGEPSVRNPLQKNNSAPESAELNGKRGFRKNEKDKLNKDLELTRKQLPQKSKVPTENKALDNSVVVGQLSHNTASHQPQIVTNNNGLQLEGQGLSDVTEAMSHTPQSDNPKTQLHYSSYGDEARMANGFTHKERSNTKSRHPLDVCIAFAKFEQTINPRILDPSLLGAARWRDGRDDYLIDAWLAGQYRPMEADHQRKVKPLISQAERDLVVGGQCEVSGNQSTLGSQSTDKIELDREAISYWPDLEVRRQMAFAVLPDTEKTRLIEEKIWQLKHSPRAKQYRQMPADSLREYAIYQLQKDLIAGDSCQ